MSMPAHISPIRIYLLCIAFPLLLIIPLAFDLLNIKTNNNNSENRSLAAKPKLSFKTLEKFPQQYESYYNDHFFQRDFLVSTFNHLHIDYFKKSPIPQKVILGKKDWLYFANTELTNYKGTGLFSEKELKSIVLELEYRKHYLEKLGIKAYFTIAPAKAIIYPEYMPDNIIKVNDIGYGRQLFNYLKEHSSIQLIDMYQTQWEAKKYGRLYHITDNHWNDLGGFYAAMEILKVIKKDFPQVDTINIAEYRTDTVVSDGGNLAKMISMSQEYQEAYLTPHKKNGFFAADGKLHPYKNIPTFNYPEHYEKVKITGNKKKPNILIIRDSFGRTVFPYLAESFNKSVMIWDAWQYKLNEEIVLSEKPDIMLFMLLEDKARALLNNQSRHKQKEIIADSTKRNY